MTTATLSKVDQITDRIDRLKRQECTLKNSNAKQVRIMIGDFTPFVISDSVYPTKEFKAEYLKRLKNLRIELQGELMELQKQEYNPFTTAS